jgi:integral membrane protein (TIGR01906 family)
MEDVRALFFKADQARRLALAVLFALLVVLAFSNRTVTFLLQTLARALALVLALVLVATIFSVAFFPSTFHGVHVVAFKNDFWMLDPAVDRLIVLYPPSFFRAALVRVAGLTLFGTLTFFFLLLCIQGILRRGAFITSARDEAKKRS